MRVYLDTEFIDTGDRIILISIGMTDQNLSRMYYAVSTDFPVFWPRNDPWLGQHVWPHLPQTADNQLDTTHEDVKSPDVIAAEVSDWFRHVPSPQLWAHWPAYDTVALMQLWGRMADRPPHIPGRINDLQQTCEHEGIQVRRLPEQPARLQHHAYHDAVWCRDAHEYVRRVVRQRHTLAVHDV
jgi:hypothetical protein